MSEKINVSDIIRKHYVSAVLIEGKTSKADVLCFIILPFMCALVFPFKGWILSDQVLSIFVNLGAIFTALLMSVLVMIFDQYQKTKEKLKILPENYDQVFVKKIKLRIEVMEELFANISYSVVVSVLLVFSALCHQMLGVKHVFTRYVMMPLCILLVVNLLLTVLMVVKRTFILVSKAD